MDIKNGLKTLQWHSKTAKYILSNIIEILDKLDTLDNINPATDGERQNLIGQKDDEQVKFYNCLQAFLDYQEEFRNNLCSTGVERELTSKLLENDTDPDEVIRRSGEVYAGLFQEYYYPNVWEESDFKAKIQSLKTDLKDRIVNRLMREDEIPEFKDRLVVSGLNEDFISKEPMTLERAKRKAGDWVLWLDLYLHNVCRLQNEVATILDKAYSRFNLHSNTLTTKRHLIKSDILSRDNIIKAVLRAAVEKGFMQEVENCFEWLKSSHLIPFFCERVCNVFANEEDNESKYAMFNNIIIFKGKPLTNIDISQFRKNWYKTPSRKGKIFAPKGYLEIEDFIEEMKDSYVNYID